MASPLVATGMRQTVFSNGNACLRVGFGWISYVPLHGDRLPLSDDVLVSRIREKTGSRTMFRLEV